MNLVNGNALGWITLHSTLYMCFVSVLWSKSGSLNHFKTYLATSSCNPRKNHLRICLSANCTLALSSLGFLKSQAKANRRDLDHFCKIKMSRILSRQLLTLSSESSWLNSKATNFCGGPRRFVQSKSKLNPKEEFLRRQGKEHKFVDLTNLPPNEKNVIFKVKEVVTQIPPVNEVMAADESMQSGDYFQVHNLFTVKHLFDARVHMGHKIGSLHPNMRPFIFGNRFGSLIFDLDLTAFHLRQALNFAAHIAYRKGIIMFVTRAPATLHLVERTAIECGEYAHTRAWEETVFTDTAKKFGGITRLPDLVIFVNMLDTVLAQHRAITDAGKLLIPTIAIVDSNCDPNLITYPIPGNDDTPCAIELYCKLFKESILRGKNKRKLVESRSTNTSSSSDQQQQQKKIENE